jgi:hypothetical protein
MGRRAQLQPARSVLLAPSPPWAALGIELELQACVEQLHVDDDVWRVVKVLGGVGRLWRRRCAACDEQSGRGEE